MAREKKSFFERLAGAVKVSPEIGEQEARKELDDRSRAHMINNSLSAGDEEAGELSVDVFQTPSEIVVRALVAGVRPEDLDIVITRDMITLRGKRETERSITDDNYFFKELFWGSFSRTIVLPQEVDPEEAEATEKHGLITIKLPKVDKSKQMKVRVKSVG